MTSVPIFWWLFEASLASLLVGAAYLNLRHSKRQEKELLARLVSAKVIRLPGAELRKRFVPDAITQEFLVPCDAVLMGYKAHVLDQD